MSSSNSLDRDSCKENQPNKAPKYVDIQGSIDKPFINSDTNLANLDSINAQLNCDKQNSDASNNKVNDYNNNFSFRS